MKSSWKKVKIGQLGRIVTGKTPKTSDSENYGGKIPFLTPTDDMLSKFVLATERTLTEQGVNSVRNQLLPAGAVAVSCIGSQLGKVTITTKPTVTNQQINSIIVDESNFDNDFVYYAMSILGKRLRYVAGVSTAVPIVNKSSFSQYEVLVPDIEEQRKISSVLSALDNKIAINKAINKNLEATAQAIFQELLSNEYDMCLISDFIVINPSRKLRKGELARYIDMKQLSTSSCCPIGYSKKEFDGGARFINGDTLLARITPCFENGKAAYIDCLNDDEVAFGSTEYIVLSPKIGVPSEFAYCLVRYDAFREYAKKNMNGSSGRQRISTDALENYEIPAIKLDKLKSFGVVAHSLFNQIRNVFFENQRLAAIRDALLPKLMSGEIDVSQVKI